MLADRVLLPCTRLSHGGPTQAHDAGRLGVLELKFFPLLFTLRMVRKSVDGLDLNSSSHMNMVARSCLRAFREQAESKLASFWPSAVEAGIRCTSSARLRSSQALSIHFATMLGNTKLCCDQHMRQRGSE